MVGGNGLGQGREGDGVAGQGVGVAKGLWAFQGGQEGRDQVINMDRGQDMRPLAGQRQNATFGAAPGQGGHGLAASHAVDFGRAQDGGRESRGAHELFGLGLGLAVIAAGLADGPGADQDEAGVRAVAGAGGQQIGGGGDIGQLIQAGVSGVGQRGQMQHGVMTGQGVGIGLRVKQVPLGGLKSGKSG